MSRMDGQTCKTCEAFEPEDQPVHKATGYGECRYKDPVADTDPNVMVFGQAVWPRVKPAHWCRKHEPRFVDESILVVERCRGCPFCYALEDNWGACYHPKHVDFESNVEGQKHWEGKSDGPVPKTCPLRTKPTRVCLSRSV